jgi:uncharacterized protein YjiS (DUF1127 family)
MATTVNVFEAGARAQFPRLPRLLAQFSDFRARRAQRSRIIRELNAHTDSQLADMGFVRSDIRALANGTYRR